MKIEI